MPFAPSRIKRHKRSRSLITTLTLTSLMDAFTIILIFLLKSYSAQGDILAVDPRLKLPVSNSRETPEMRLIVQISVDDIIVDSVKVAEVKDVMDTQGLLIKPLFEALNKNTIKTEFIAKNNPSIEFAGEVVVQGDRRIPFLLLERIMYTCGQAGYSSISLAVISRE